MRRTLLCVIGLLSLGTPATRAAGQAVDDDCFIVSSGTMNVFNGRTPQELVFIGGGARFRCPNGTTISSDSVARFTGQGIIEFIKNVRYTDDENVLTAAYVRYIEAEEHAVAQGDVVLTDRATGSVIQAPVLDYYQATENREESLVRIASGRPHAILVSTASTDTIGRDTTVVDADRMDITGRSSFHGWGNVELTRADVIGVGEEALYDRDAGTLRLITEARLTSEDYVLSGDTVDAWTNELDEIEELTSRGRARLDGSDVVTAAPFIRLFFEAGEVSRLVAVGVPAEDPPAEGPPEEEEEEEIQVIGEPFDLALQAVVTSKDFQLTADSIDVIAPAQVLDRVVAVGRARSERLGDDLANANVPAVAARDWMRGDTVIATFMETLDADPDSAGANNVEVETVVAVGTGERATSSYRVRDQQDADAEPGINYMLARRITIHMKEGNVASVEAFGDVQGMYLQPVSRTGQSGAGSVNR